MANPQQREILRKGVTVWNSWRNENPDIKIDLQGVGFREDNLAEVNLRLANLWKADFRRANLERATLSEAYLSDVNFWEAILEDADLSNADLSYAILNEANLTRVNLGRAELKEASLSKTDLSGADLRGSNLSGADLEAANLQGSSLGGTLFSGAVLFKTDFSGAKIGKTIFSNNDLSQSLNLDKVFHIGPSIIDERTFVQSKGKIPESFLRGCGFTDTFIEFAKLYNPNLPNEQILNIQYRIYDLRATQAIQISPLFISYSHADSTFVDHLDSSLTSKGVRFWRDIHDATAGRLETQIDRAIRQNPTVLLILSKNSIKSDWVEHEVRKARELEKKLGRDALCPVALDDGWTAKPSPWPERVMEQIMEYNILDFSGWQDQPTFDSKFAKLLSGLDLFYKKPAA